MSAVEKFPILLSEAEEESSAVPPCFSDEGINVRLPQRQAKTLCPLFFRKSTVLLPAPLLPLPISFHWFSWLVYSYREVSTCTFATTICISLHSRSETQMPPRFSFSYTKSSRSSRSISRSSRRKVSGIILWSYMSSSTK